MLLVGTLTLLCCTTAPEKKNYVTFSGSLTNAKTDSIFILNRGFEKVILLNQDGSFSDTLKVTDGTYYFSDGKNNTLLYLKNGDVITMTANSDAFSKSIGFEGTGAINNNYLAQKAQFEQQLFTEDYSSLDEEALNKKVASLENEILTFIAKNTEVDSILKAENKTEAMMMLKGMKSYYLEGIQLKKALPKGSPSPTFINYESVDQKRVSLSDFKGRYVYIDVWATWCAPCIAEIPFLKALEHDYKEKDIAFVSLSIDDDKSHIGSWEIAKEKWRTMIQEKSLGGYQLFAPEGWKSTFVMDYKIVGIPRFILIDKEGNIVSPDAPRPSSEKLRIILDELL